MEKKNYKIKKLKINIYYNIYIFGNNYTLKK